MSIEAMSLFWESLQDVPHAFVSLCGEEFHGRPLKLCFDAEALQLWLMLPRTAPMVRRMHLNPTAFIVVNNAANTFAARVVGELIASDDDVSRQRVLRIMRMRAHGLSGSVIARFLPRSGEAWLGASLEPAKLAFTADLDLPRTSAPVVPLDVAKHRNLHRHVD